MLIRYLLCWVLLAVVAVANAVLREATYGKRVSELSAHRISTVTGIVLTGALVWGLSRLWPIESPGQAWLIGACWVLATIAFEFGFGHFVVGAPWGKLLADYDVSNGRVWLLFLAWMMVMPYVFYKW